MPFSHWKPFLSNGDYEILETFINNLVNNIQNDKMLILSGNGGRNGKTTLINEIKNYIGGEKYFHNFIFQSIVFTLPIKKLIHICAPEDFRLHYIQQLANVIQYKQSVICDTNNIDTVDYLLLQKSYVIQMSHVFLE
jgi:hypothetical protein